MALHHKRHVLTDKQAVNVMTSSTQPSQLFVKEQLFMDGGLYWLSAVPLRYIFSRIIQVGYLYCSMSLLLLSIFTLLLRFRCSRATIWPGSEACSSPWKALIQR